MAKMDKDLNRISSTACPNSNCEYNHQLEGANFCMLCGTLLYQRCDDCLSSNPKYAKFCHYCGTSLQELRSIEVQYEDVEDAGN
jgi:glutaredoxin-related protein